MIKAIRDGVGQALVELGKSDLRVVVLTGDLAESTRVHWFQEKFPERFFEVGVAEQNLMGVAAGLALSGKTPFVASYAVFSPGRSWDQLRVSVCYSQANVKIIGGHAGLTVGPDGATHQALEDLAITRCLPNLTVLCPCDYDQAYQATLAAAQHSGPVYLRTCREKTAVVTSQDSPFQIGQAQVLQSGSNVTVVACGVVVSEALQAAQVAAEAGISVEVINNHTIKPLDSETLLTSVRKTGAVVTVEEHQVFGGMGSAVVEMLSQHQPVPVEMVGVQDRFGQSGTAAELLEKYQLTAPFILRKIKQVLSRKK